MARTMHCMKEAPAFSLGSVCIFNCICSFYYLWNLTVGCFCFFFHLFFFPKQVVNTASTPVILKTHRVLLGTLRWARRPLAVWGQETRVTPPAGGRPLTRGESSLEGIISVSKLLIVLWWCLALGLAWSPQLKSQASLTPVLHDLGVRQLEEEVISPCPTLCCLYVYPSICTFLSTRSCTLWLSGCNTCPPPEGEAFLPLRIPPLALVPLLLLGPSPGQCGPGAWWHRARGGGREEEDFCDRLLLREEEVAVSSQDPSLFTVSPIKP